MAYTLPEITHLQFLMLDLLRRAGGDGLSAHAVRGQAAGYGCDYSGPKFFQLMGRLVEAGYVSRVSKDWPVGGGGTVKRTHYYLTEEGQEARLSVINFYNTAGRMTP